MGIRPEDILVHKKRVPAANVKREVCVIEPLGSEIVLDLKVGENLIKVKTSPDFRANTGDKCWLSFDINRVHVFNKKTEKAII